MYKEYVLTFLGKDGSQYWYKFSPYSGKSKYNLVYEWTVTHAKFWAQSSCCFRSYDEALMIAEKLSKAHKHWVLVETIDTRYK